MRFVKAPLAALTLVALVIGPPLALLRFIGNPWPAEGVVLSAPLTDGAIIGLLAVIVWVLWAQVTACIVAEAGAAFTGKLSAHRVPFTLGAQQLLARRLVTALVVAGVSAPGVVGVAQATASSAIPTVASTDRHTAPSTPSAAAPAPARVATADVSPATVTVMRLDSLWSIAERVLGDGERWTDIAVLNEGREMEDGTRFVSSAPIQPGWVLHVPAEARANAPHEVTVQPGDTLSAIAQRHLGDAQEYPRLVEESAEVHQPGGARLEDPDLIHPGWTVRLPSTDSVHDPSSPREEPDSSPHGASVPDRPAPATPAPATTAPAEQPEHTTADEAEAEAQHTVAEVSGSDQGVDRLALQALLATASCLASGAFVMVVRNRRRQFKRRGIGRAIAPTSPEVGAVEEAVAEAGREAQPDAEFIDRALRYVAATCVARGVALPQLAAAVLGDDDLTLLLDVPATATAPEGWSNTDNNQSWVLPRETYLDESLDSQPAPYPALVTIGRDSAGRSWLLDLEALGVFGIGGDASQAEALIRFVIAELAVNSWAEGAEVLIGDRYSETVAVNPGRVRQTSPDSAAARVHVVARETEEATSALNVDVLARRAEGLILDSTQPLIVVISADRGEELRAHLSPTARSRAVVIHDDSTAPSIVVSSEGIAYVPRWNVTLTAMAMTADQASAMGDLLAATRTFGDVPVDDGMDTGVLGQYAKVDGTLRDEFREPRNVSGGDDSSLLPAADTTYLESAATTAADLAEVAPSVLAGVAEELEAVDPDLAADLAAWFDAASHRPKIQLLGPVEVHAAHGGDTSALSNLAGTTSFIAFLACRDRGVTGEAAAAAFEWKTQRTVQNRATDARFLLGTRVDGTDWLPDASKTEGARRGNPTYELDRGPGGVLIDADLFRRLRFRAMKRGGQKGQEDLILALSLVKGAPFEAATDRRYPWLFRGQRVDDVMVCAIEDVAHLVATKALAEGDNETARNAAVIARTANPHGDASWLDLAAATAAGEGSEAAEALLREHLDDTAEEDLAHRTEAILDQREWMAS